MNKIQYTFDGGSTIYIGFYPELNYSTYSASTEWKYHVGEETARKWMTDSNPDTYGGICFGSGAAYGRVEFCVDFNFEKNFITDVYFDMRSDILMYNYNEKPLPTPDGTLSIKIQVFEQDKKIKEKEIDYVKNMMGSGESYRLQRCHGKHTYTVNAIADTIRIRYDCTKADYESIQSAFGLDAMFAEVDIGYCPPLQLYGYNKGTKYSFLEAVDDESRLKFYKGGTVKKVKLIDIGASGDTGFRFKDKALAGIEVK